MPVEPRRPKGPALNALRAFEAAARLESFADAAEELGVTAGAVSQHVKSLEAWAGLQLFHRNSKGVALSTAGRQLAAEFSEAFDKLASATQSLRNLSPNPEIHIAALPSIAQLWLPSRLEALRHLRPDLSVSVTAMETPPRLSREVFDMSIFFAVPDGSPDQLVLAEDVIFPIAAHSLPDPVDMTTAPLLHDQTWATDWSDWSLGAGVGVGDPKRGAKHSLYALAFAEAISGAGILMGHQCLVAEALQAGQLRRLSDREVRTNRALVVNLPHRTRRRPELRDVLDVMRSPLTSQAGP